MALSEHPRIRLLRYIAENQPASVKGMREYTGMSVGSIYHHLNKLKDLVVQNRSKKYLITEYGINYLKSDEAKLDIEVKLLDIETSVDIKFVGDKRRAILEFIAKKGLASIKEMRSLKMSVGSLYHHLYTLMHEGLVAQSAGRKYALTVKSFNLLKSGIANSPLFVEVAGNANPSVEGVEENTRVEAKQKVRTIEEMLSHPKVRLLQYINEVGQVGIPEVRQHFEVSRWTAKVWLRRLKDYLAADQYGRYVLNDRGKSIIAFLQDKEVLESFLYKKPKSRSTSRFASPVPLRKHRSVYDLVAVMLNFKDGIIFQNRIIKALGISHKNAAPLLIFAESKGFIERVDRKSLPMPYSRLSVSEFWNVTDKGRDYLQRYSSLVSILV